MSVTPDFTGQIYKDTNTGNLWRANSTTPGDWTLEVQNMQYKWTPRSLKFGEEIGLLTYGDLGVVTLIMEGSLRVSPIDLEDETTITSISAPSLVSIDSTDSQGGYLYLTGLSALTTVSFPSLEYVSDSCTLRNSALVTSVDFSSLQECATLTIQDTSIPSCDLSSLVTCPTLQVRDNALMTSLDLSSLVTVSTSLNCSGNTLLSSLSAASFVPTNGVDLNFSSCALNQASVDLILARCVANAAYISGTVSLDLGTSSPPSSVLPGSDYAVLVARGVVVNVNP